MLWLRLDHYDIMTWISCGLFTGRGGINAIFTVYHFIDLVVRTVSTATANAAVTT